MKVLTIRQPWATLIMLGLKKYEFRSWKTNYRGELLIHAGKGIDKEGRNRLQKYLPENLPRGEIICKVKLVDCIKVTKEFLEELRNINKEVYKRSVFKEEYAWKLEVVEILKNPIKINGKLGLWNFNGKEDI